MQEIDVQEIKSQIVSLIEIIDKGQEVVIMKNNTPVAKLVPYSKDKPTPKFGSAKGLIVMSDDFEEPLEDFSEYTK